MERITFYTDEDVSGTAIIIARNQGVSIVTANEASMLGAGDPEHFAYAIQEGLVLVSGNIRDYRPLFNEWTASGKEHPGMVLITAKKARFAGVVASELRLIYEAYDTNMVANRILWI